MRTSRRVLIGLAMMATLTWVSAARADLDAVAQAMGASKVDSLEITGGGFMYTLGQAYQPGKAWPKLNLSRFTRSDDYAGAAHAFDYYVSRAEPQGGGGNTPQGGTPGSNGGEAGVGTLPQGGGGAATDVGGAGAGGVPGTDGGAGGTPSTDGGAGGVPATDGGAGGAGGATP